MPWQLDQNRQIWLQLEEILIRRIVSGDYPAGSRIPSVRDLAAEAGVNPNTMQRALTHLEESKLVGAQRNTGRFVTEDEALLAAFRKELAQRELEAFREKMHLLGFDTQQIMDMLQKEGST